eukprot:TRINITY_DN19813_c0_g1_i1.p1 TRINITY_DN19813_c0_g1~~TRINITY_DN19813_c0_g1_i1.p1  ORF type:complete len:300 (+),score=17.86 TRINITY_DN19813_c0_g1_i1:21-920(+)
METEIKQEQQVKQVAQLIAEADALMINTGAGMGVDSGLGTFRGRHAGVWPPLKELDMDYTDICDPCWFKEDPPLGWAFWHFCWKAYTESKPHRGYELLRDWAKDTPLGSFFFTSNIDGHWTRVGVPDSQLEECHGVVSWLQCARPCCEEIWPTPDLNHLELDEQGHRITNELPKCIRCGELARPAILMFGDWLYSGSDRERAATRARRDWEEDLARQPNEPNLVVVELGAGTTVPTVRYQSEKTVSCFPKASLVRINLDQPQIPRSVLEAHPQSISLAMGALDACQAIEKAMADLKGQQ